MKINTVADRIRNNLINPKMLSNMQQFANKEEMILKSIQLKDGTCAKILANALEYDCLIMKNGKVLTARGKAANTDDVALGILGLFEHIQKRRRAESSINMDNESFGFMEEFLKKYDKFMEII